MKDAGRKKKHEAMDNRKTQTPTYLYSNVLQKLILQSVGHVELEDDVVGEDVLHDADGVLRLALCKFHLLRALCAGETQLTIPMPMPAAVCGHRSPLAKGGG